MKQHSNCLKKIAARKLESPTGPPSFTPALCIVFALTSVNSLLIVMLLHYLK